MSRSRSAAVRVVDPDLIQVRPARGTPIVTTITGLAGAFMAALGIWALGWPRSFAKAADFPYDEHFVRDAGAFQLGLGVGLLIALIWRDSLTTALAGFVVANTLHAVNHAFDRDAGGHGFDGWLLGLVSVVVLAALVARIAMQGWVVGHVRPAANPRLLPFVEQKTVLLTTYRRSGTPVATPVSLAVDGYRAVFRTYERAGKVPRLRHDPRIEIAPCTAVGRRTGPGMTGNARELAGREALIAARLLRRKYPLLHAVVVPLAHRLLRPKTGRTMHFEVRLQSRDTDGRSSAAGQRP